MSKTKYRFTYDEVRVIVIALIELKNQLTAEGRYTDAVDELLVRFVDYYKASISHSALIYKEKYHDYKVDR